jgi:hypothetical protein
MRIGELLLAHYSRLQLWLGWLRFFSVGGVLFLGVFLVKLWKSNVEQQRIFN